VQETALTGRKILIWLMHPFSNGIRNRFILGTNREGLDEPSITASNAVYNRILLRFVTWSAEYMWFLGVDRDDRENHEHYMAAFHTEFRKANTSKQLNPLLFDINE
jgi:hypothetical protein